MPIKKILGQKFLQLQKIRVVEQTIVHKIILPI